MTVAVLGHRGMLGSVVARRWAEQGAIVETTDLRYPDLVLWADGHDYIVNCLRMDDPLLMAEAAAVLSGPVTIQPSSDAVNETTPYAQAKRITEALPGVIIRAGIVDIRRQPAVAYTDWLCNPLTPLEWADAAWNLKHEPWCYHIGRESLTRYEVVATVAEVFGTEPPLASVGPEPLDRLVEPSWPYPPLREALIAYRDWLG